MADGPTREEVLDWLTPLAGRRLTAAEQADILSALGRDGEDAFELLEHFGRSFGVDLGSYRWDLFHRDESRLLQPGWPIPVAPPCGMVFPISVTQLHSSARAGKWVGVWPDLVPGRSWHLLNWPLLIIGLPLLTLLGLSILF